MTAGRTAGRGSRWAGPAVVVILAGLAAGCAGKPVDPPGVWVGGKPVEHWLEMIRASEPNLRAAAVDRLALVGGRDARAVPAVIAALDDAEAVVRSGAVAAVSRLGPVAGAAAPRLERLQEDPDPLVRSRAGVALARVRGTAADQPPP